MKDWGFCGPTYQSQSPNVDDEDCMNAYCEQSGSPNAKTPIALLHTPGKKLFANLAGETSVPSLFSVNGRTFAAASNLYELLGGGQVVDRGSLGVNPVTPTMMTSNETQLVILNNGSLFVLVYKGAITEVRVEPHSAGTGYSVGDTFSIIGTPDASGVTGSGATGTVTAIAAGTGIATANVHANAAGTGYAVGDTGKVNGGTVAAKYKVTAVGPGTAVAAANVTSAHGGAGYAVGDTGTIGGGSATGGSGATYKVTAVGLGTGIAAANVSSGHGGSGYAVGDTGKVRNGTGAIYTVTEVSGGAVSSFSVTHGTGYAIANNVGATVLTGLGDGAFEIDITALTTGVVTEFTLTAAGAGYALTTGESTSILTGSGDGTLEIDVTALTAGLVTAFTLTDAGSGYALTTTGNATTALTGAGDGTFEIDITALTSGLVSTFTFTPGSNYSVGVGYTTSIISANGTPDNTLEVRVDAVADNYLFAVDMTQFDKPIAQIGFVDGYVIATLRDSHTFQQSNLEDATVWDGLNIATLSYFPDNIVSMICNARTIQFSSAKKTVWYYNAGAGSPVFTPIQGAFYETGSAATFGICQTADNSVFMLSQDERGSLIAVLATGFSGKRVSTHAVELAWQTYATTSDAVSFSYQEYGHTFVEVYFPTANATWVYDLTTGYWHKRGFWLAANGTYIANRAMSHTLNFGIHLVGDWASGTVYQLSSEFSTDFGNMIRGYRRSPTLAKDNKWIYFNQLEIDAEVGLGVSAADLAMWKSVYGVPPLVDGDGNARAPQLMLRWSDDAGKTWSKTYTLSVGSLGEYNQRVIKRMLGRGRKRLWEVSWTDPIPWRFADAYLEAEPQMA